eukprot:12287894-Ditylum_brightwellii.AAC.1
MMKIVKCKPVEMAEGKFDLVEAILEGDALTHWLEFKQAEVACMSKNSDGSDIAPLGMCTPTFAIFLQELKKHYFLENASHLQKAYLCNYIKKRNKLTIKNTTASLHNVNGMMARFLVPRNNPMADDELCDILYQMVKHDWHDALHKSGRNPSDMNLQDLTDYFEQIELLKA